MAARGHQIILLTEALAGASAGPTPGELPNTIKSHDWSTPLILPVYPVDDVALSKFRHGKFDPLFRRAFIACTYLKHGGLFGDWVKAARAYEDVISQTFRPEVVWASFGNTGVWNIGQGIARSSHCPWVADIKDNWQNFIPKGLRRWVASTYQDAAEFTTFSEGQSAEADLWFHQKKTVVYSGFDETDAEPVTPSRDLFEIFLTGSIYLEDNFAGFVAGLEGWLQSRSGTSHRPVRFSYAGNDAERVGKATTRLEGLCELDVGGYLPLDKLIARQHAADVNAYIRMPGAYIFHHKLFELLNADRPILVYPKEVQEAETIASDVGGALFSCGSTREIEKALDHIEKSVSPSVNHKHLMAYSWQGQAELLESVLNNVRRSQ